MYLLQFINEVRSAQGAEGLEHLPAEGSDGSDPTELAMGCRYEGRHLMRLSSPQAAASVSDATGLPVGLDRMTVSIPQALDRHASEVHRMRVPVGSSATS